MKYIIMCGGKYDFLTYPKHLFKVNGEVLVERTIRLLKECGVEDIFISSNDKRFDNLGVPRLEHENNYSLKKDKVEGYWVDAFYPCNEPVCYMYGDVYYSKKAVNTIVNETSTNGILFYGSKNYRNNPLYFKDWEEPFAFKVVDIPRFRRGIDKCKVMRDKGLTNREPVSWELYRVLNGYDINTHIIRDNYVAIDDFTTDIDHEEDIKELEKILKEFNSD